MRKQLGILYVKTELEELSARIIKELIKLAIINKYRINNTSK